MQLVPANASTIVTHLLLGLLLSGCLVAAGCGDSRESGPQQAGFEVSYKQFASVEVDSLTGGDGGASLGLDPSGGAVRLADGQADIMVVELLDMYCTRCQKSAPAVNELHGLVQASDLKDRVKFVGIAKKNTKMEAEVYVDRYEVPFPVSADPQTENIKKLGMDHTPTFIVVDLKKKKVVDVQKNFTTAREFFEKLKGIAGD